MSLHVWRYLVCKLFNHIIRLKFKCTLYLLQDNVYNIFFPSSEFKTHRDYLIIVYNNNRPHGFYEHIFSICVCIQRIKHTTYYRVKSTQIYTD